MPNYPEQQLVPVPTVTQSTEADKFSALIKYTDVTRNNALVFTNAALPPKKEATVARLPQLPESIQSGYVRGVSSSITCCAVNGHLIEKNTAYDYLMMASAAATYNISLRIIVAFRTMEVQQRLYNERMQPGGKPNHIAARLGAAAKPGHSNHQSGIALDIDVGMTTADYKAKKYTPTFKWLLDNAEKFGFNHSDGAPVNEPWHWIHPDKKIVGAPAYQAITGFQIDTAETALAASNTNQTGISRVLAQEAHDLTVGSARSLSMCTSSRDTFQNASSIFNANTSNFLASLRAQLDTTALNVLPTSFEPNSLKAFSYNFETGVWEDNGEPV